VFCISYRQKQANIDIEQLTRERDELRQMLVARDQKILELNDSLQTAKTEILTMKLEEERLRNQTAQMTSQLE
jgi:hypothetical protein